MFQPAKEQESVEILPLPVQETATEQALSTALTLPDSPEKISKAEIRSSLKVLTLEGIVGSLGYSIIGGALLSNFLLDLGANPVEIGMLASIPQLANLLQPLGAYIAERTTSRRWYSRCIFLPSRLMWLLLVPAIWLVNSSTLPGHQLVQLTLAIVWITNIMEALGRASWVSWMAALVNQRLRGRYFGFRNSIVNLANLIGVPLVALAVSKSPFGSLQGYGIFLVLGVGLGLASLICQCFMADVNPQLVKAAQPEPTDKSRWGGVSTFLNNKNFLRFLVYSGAWSFAVNVSAPYFNLYLLDNLSIDISVVTLYNSLGVGANLLMLLFWGKLADKVGNRPLMIVLGVLVSLTPLLWLEAGTAPIFLWFWFPLLYIVGGATWAAIDLCSGNLMMSVSPLLNQSIYFAIAAAVPGVTGALGVTLGGFLATITNFGGIPALFALSAVLRLAALIPLVFVQEQRSISLTKFWLLILSDWWREVPTEPGEVAVQPLVAFSRDLWKKVQRRD